jgi:Protein of unknown function (DUF2442)
MIELRRIRSADYVMHGVVKLVFDDGFEGLVDFRGFMALGHAYAPMNDRAYFKTFSVGDGNFSLGWGPADDPDIDFGADRLHELAHTQADLLAKAS